MSYLAGLALGNLLAEQLGKAGSSGGIKLVHGMAGRRRYHDPGLKWDIEYAKGVEGFLTEARGIEKVAINRVTGSLVVNYSCSEEAMDNLIGKLPGLSGTSRLRKGVRGVFANLNRGVYKSSGGFLDLPTFLAAVFLVLGLKRTISLRQWPNGAQMMWWSYNLMKNNYYNPGRQPDEVHQTML